MPRLLVVHHTPSPSLHAMVDAVLAGAGDPLLAEVDVVARPALLAGAADALGGDGYVLVAPANLGTMAGALKHFFDLAYYPCLGATDRRPWGLVLHGQNDVDGAVRDIRRIVTGLGWSEVTAPVRVTGDPDAGALAACRDVGATVAATLL